MNRTAIAIIAAFSALTGCAQDDDGVVTRADTPTHFAGIERSVPVGDIIAPITAFGIDASRSEWEVSDLPTGGYWMAIDEVISAEGDVQMEAGHKQIAMVMDQDGLPMLQGMAVIMERDGMLVAAQADVETADPTEGRCERTSKLAAKGMRTAEDRFEMTIAFEDSVIGEDCAKMGLGEESMESITFRATFSAMTHRSEDQVVDGEKG